MRGESVEKDHNHNRANIKYIKIEDRKLVTNTTVKKMLTKGMSPEHLSSSLKMERAEKLKPRGRTRHTTDPGRSGGRCVGVGQIVHHAA